MVTVRPEREKLVAFSEPTRTNVSEVVVTGPGAPPIATVDDLAGQEVFVRKGSIYEESLIKLNEQLKARGKPPAVFVEAPAVLEDDDVLEMVNAGLAPITIVDDYLAEFWSKVFTDMKVHQDIAVRSGGSLAVAFRKDNPRLREVVNTWIRKHGTGRRIPERDRTSLSREHQVREERRGRRRAPEVPGGGRVVQEIRRAVRPRLPADGGAGLSGVDAESERQEPRWRDRRDAGHARDRQGTEGRRHHARSMPTSTPA